MDPRIFTNVMMDLQHRSPINLTERLRYSPTDNLLYVNFEGLSIEASKTPTGWLGFSTSSWQATVRRCG